MKLKFSFVLFGKTCKTKRLRHHAQNTTRKTDCSGAENLSYNTKQSKMVFDILLENKDRHLTADEIFEKLRKKAGRASVKQRFTAILKAVRLGRGTKIHGRRRRQRVLSIRRQKRRMPRALPPQMHRMRQAHTRRMQIFERALRPHLQRARL